MTDHSSPVVEAKLMLLTRRKIARFGRQLDQRKTRRELDATQCGEEEDEGVRRSVPVRENGILSIIPARVSGAGYPQGFGAPRGNN